MVEKRLLILILALWLLGDIMLPFIAGLALAYFLDPVADALERLGLPRIAATLLILITSIVAIVVLLVLLIPVLGDQIARFASNLPNLMQALVKLGVDAAFDVTLTEVIQREGIRALSFIPLSYGGRLMGKFMVYFDRPHVMSDEDAALAHAIAGTLAIGIERKTAETQLRQHQEQLQAFADQLEQLEAPGLQEVDQLEKRGGHARAWRGWAQRSE